MKKLLALCLTLVMVASLGLTAFAARGAFLSSPSANAAPQIISVVRGSEDCTAEIKVTAYADRFTLTDEQRAELEEAYNQIANESKDFTDVLKKIAEELGVKESELSISDLFYMHYVGCVEHVEKSHKGFTITLKADTLDNLVDVLCFNNGKWERVQIVSIDKEAGTVTIYIENMGAIAFVVNKFLTPDTGDNSMVYLWAALAGVSAVALVATTKKSKKQEA